MFQPNALKTLMDMKIHKELSENSSGLSNSSDEEGESGIDRIVNRDFKNPIQIIRQTKHLLKEVNESLSNLKKWKENENYNFLEKMEFNKEYFAKKKDLSDQNIQEKEEYIANLEQYVSTLTNIAEKYASSITSNNSLYPPLSSSIYSQVEEANQKLAESISKSSVVCSNDYLIKFQKDLMEKLNFQKLIQRIEEKKNVRSDSVSPSYQLSSSSFNSNCPLTSSSLLKEKETFEKMSKEKEKERIKIDKELEMIDQEFEELENLMK